MSLCINPSCLHPQNPDNNKYCLSCGSELLLMGHYRVTRLLSNKGGFGNTYEVVDVVDNDTPKVLKVLTQDHPHAVELFQQEAEVLNKLNHPGIPKGEGSFTYFPRNSQIPLHCLVMEKIEGMDLEEYQKQNKFQPISQDLALEWLSQLVNILHEVHHRNFFHRDIKPSNVILRPDGQLTLIDFGAVRQVTATILAGGQNTMISTVGYAPPEQERGYAVQQSDFYALGRTFVYLLTGKAPNDSAIYDYHNNELHWRKLAPHIDERLAAFIDELIAEKVSQRPANTSEIIKRIKQIKTDLLQPPPTPSPPTISQHKTSTQTQPKSKQKIIISPAADIDTVKYAGFWARFNAAIIDQVIVMIMAALAGGFLSFKLETEGLLSQWGIKAIKPIKNLIIASATASILGTTILGLFLTVLGIVIFWITPEQVMSYLPSFPYKQEAKDFLILLKQNIFLLAPVVLGGLIKWVYFVFLESFLKATLGKFLLGLRVTNLKHQNLSLSLANRRYWTKLLSALPLYSGFILAGLTKRKRALHDWIAGSIIVKKDNN